METVDITPTWTAPTWTAMTAMFIRVLDDVPDMDIVPIIDEFKKMAELADEHVGEYVGYKEYSERIHSYVAMIHEAIPQSWWVHDELYHIARMADERVAYLTANGE